jgi:hypothetical protein
VVHHEHMTSAPRAAVRGRFTAAAVAAAVVLAVVGSVVAVGFDRSGTAVFVDALSIALVVAVVAVVGAIVALAVPGNRVGWLLLTAAAVLGVGAALTEAGIHGVVIVPGSVPGAAYLAALGPALEAAGMLIAVVGVPVVFPDGRLPGPRWRWLAWSAIAAVSCLFLGNVLAPHTQESRLAGWHSPLGVPVRYGNIADAFSAAGVLLAVAAEAGAITGLVAHNVRHARARRCRVSIACTPAGPAVEVTDDGTGLVAAGQIGHGLAIMRERAEELGGTVTVRDGPPGVTVEARPPAVTAPAHLSVPAVPA